MKPSTYADRLRAVLRAEAPEYTRSSNAEGAELDFSFGEARFTWPDDVLASLVAPSGALLRYQSPKGSPALRAAVLAASPRARPDGLNADNVLITCGAKQALWLAFLTQVKPGDRVLLPRPGWAPYAIWTRISGGEILWYDPAEGTADGVIRDISAGAADHVLINSPHNPTGVEYGQAVIDRIAAAAKDAGVRIISDEVYRCFAATGGSFLPHVDPARSGVAVVDGLSKSAGAAGLRIGFLVAGRPTIEDATIVRGTVDSCPSGVSQACAQFLLSDAARRFRDGVRALAHTTVRGLVKRLEAEAIPVASSGGMYVWVQGGTGDGRVRLAGGRVLRGSPGSGFGAGGYTRLCPVTDDPRCADLLQAELSVPGLAS